MSSTLEQLPPLLVEVTREIPLETFILRSVDSGQTEELDPEEAREWFRSRNANMTEVESALDYVWNFGTYRPVVVEIQQPKHPRTFSDKHAPKI
jgi:hypothetical protein